MNREKKRWKIVMDDGTELRGKHLGSKEWMEAKGDETQAHPPGSKEANVAYMLFSLRLQRIVAQRCIISHRVFDHPLTSHAVTGEAYNEADPLHLLVDDFEAAELERVLETAAPESMRQEGRRLAKSFRATAARAGGKTGKGDPSPTA